MSSGRADERGSGGLLRQVSAILLGCGCSQWSEKCVIKICCRCSVATLFIHEAYLWIRIYLINNLHLGGCHLRKPT